MKAIVLDLAGSVANFSIKDIDKPTPKANEVLIAIKALSINPVDYKVRANENVLNAIYGETRPAILGWDIAGTVVALGGDVSKFKIGDKVFGMVNFVGQGNTYAEYVSSPEDHLAIIPEGVSFEEAAATTLAALTALQVLKDRVKKGDRILIHAGSGGVGHFAIQIAKSLGAHVITTSSVKNKAFVFSLGADEFIDYRTQQFQDEVSNLDFVFDMFNGEILLNSIKVVKEGGKIISLPTPDFSDEILGLAKERNVDVSFLMVHSNGEDMQTLAIMLSNGSIKPSIFKTYRFEDMAKAHEQQESGRTVGKIIITL